MNNFDKPLFYHQAELDEQITLSEEESRHCLQSLRLRLGDEVFVTNGRGSLGLYGLVDIKSKFVILKLKEKELKEPSRLFKRLCVAPPKTSDRLDWMIEKAVEIGVDEIVFLQTRYSERDKINLERAQKIAISAIKQSKQVYLPTIIGVIKWKDFVSTSYKGGKYIAYVEESCTSPLLVNQLSNQLTEVTILIGPEGDFSEDEVKEVKNGYQMVSLGKNVLRTETAALYSLAIFNAFA